jgi:hypothetical protein
MVPGVFIFIINGTWVFKFIINGT